MSLHNLAPDCRNPSKKLGDSPSSSELIKKLKYAFLKGREIKMPKCKQITRKQLLLTNKASPHAATALLLHPTLCINILIPTNHLNSL